MTLAASYVGFRFPRVRPILEPEPLILVEDGKVIEKNLRKERMTAAEIAGEARLQQIDSLDKVQVGGARVGRADQLHSEVG